MRNVRDHLPEKMRGPVTKRMRKAYHADSALQAQGMLEALARELERTHPGAAGSLREGMTETLTVLRIDVPDPGANPAVDQRDRVDDLDLS